MSSKPFDLFPPDPGSLPLPPGAPLSARMRPRTLDEYAGQTHILGPNSILRRAIETDRFTSLIFYGPPGVGKTSLAEVISLHTNHRFISLSGVESNVTDIRKSIQEAQNWLTLHQRGTILFIDEIHRFSKPQQDALLPHIERGTVRFIGATTHNPYFYINSPLVSRSQIFELEPLTKDALLTLLQRATHDKTRGLGHQAITLTPPAADYLAEYAEGDARRALNALELAVITAPPADHHTITREMAVQSMQAKHLLYDNRGDQHYDTISAFIKSIRGSDPDAALYWLAKMISAGEDPRFIARRLVILASEDIGLADPNAIQVAVAAQQALDFIGMPEGRIPLAHATVHLATAPKSNSAYAALTTAMADVASGRTLAVPLHLRTKFRKQIASASGADQSAMQYLYSHDYEGSYIPQAYLPEGRTYYHPTENGAEKRIKERLEHWRNLPPQPEP